MISKGSPDLSKHVFEVALSFPGEVRAYVEAVDRYLTETVGLDACFYDKRYPAQLARPSLDTFLQDIYRRSKFIVAFICADYDKKEWCDVEFRVIRDIIKSRAVERVMYVRMDHAPVAGVMSIDGYVDGREYDPAQIAAMVWERIRLLSNAGPQGGSTFLVDQDRIEGPPSAGDKENAIGNGLDELHNEATRVRLSWARDNVTEVRFHNDTDDYTHEVRIEVTSLERQLQSGNWFVADVIGATLPLQLGHGGITIRPEKTWGFSFLKQSMAARITFSCAAERNGMGEFSLKERGRYRVRFTASWSGGQRAFEGVFNWTKDRPPLVEGMMSPVSAAPD